MLYHVTKSLIYASLRGYFKSIEFIGKENLNYKKSTIYIVNHPSALLDPLITATIMPGKLHFIAAAEFFGNRFTSWIMRKQFNMIPVYRPTVHGTTQADNDRMFRHCYECLNENGSIMIFPEGTSKTERRLRELKTGTIRIYRGALAHMTDQRPIDIIPIGINYTNPHQFQSKVVISIGKPVDFSALNYSSSWNESEIIKQETLFIQKKLQEHIIHIENPTTEPLIEKVTEVFRFDLWKEFGVNKKDTAAKFSLQKQIIAAVEHAELSNPDELEKLTEKLDYYLDRLKKMRLSEKIIKRSDIGIGTLIYSLLLLPVFILGIAINGVPYLISSGLFRLKFKKKIAKNEDDEGISPQFKGTIIFAIGVLIFTIWYLIIGLIVANYTSYFYLPLFFLLFYFSAVGSLRFLSGVYWMWKKFRLWLLELTSNPQVRGLIFERKSILEILQKLKNEYRDAVKKI